MGFPQVGAIPVFSRHKWGGSTGRKPDLGGAGGIVIAARWGSRAGTGTHRTQEKWRGHTTEPADRWCGRHPAPAPLGARRGRARDRLRGARPIGSAMLRHNVAVRGGAVSRPSRKSPPGPLNFPGKLAEDAPPGKNVWQNVWQ